MNLLQTIPLLVLGAGLTIFPPQQSAALTVHEVLHLATASTDFPVVKSAGLSPDMHVPWSKPVRVIDPFEGDFLAVFDKNSLGGYLYRGGARQVISLWSRSRIRVLLVENSSRAGSLYNAGLLYPRTVYPRAVYPRVIYPRLDYLEFVTTKQVVKLLLKVREQVFQLEGSNGTFAVSDELATALKNAPAKNLDIRLVLEGGETVDSEIGSGTVKAWRSIY